MKTKTKQKFKKILIITKNIEINFLSVLYYFKLV